MRTRIAVKLAVVGVAFVGLLMSAGVASAIVGNWSSSVPLLSNPTEYYVATNGASTAAGTIGAPWDIVSALNGSHTIAPGSIIWIRGGTYVWADRSHVPGNYGFIVRLTGSSSAPIHVRAYPSERAVIDGGLDIGRNGICSYMWLWDLEMIVHEEGRTSVQTGSDPRDLPGPLGILSMYEVQNSKIVNFHIHTVYQGISWWTGAYGPSNSEVHGCCIYDNGWIAPDRAHGHGMYCQNNTGIKTISNNIISTKYGSGQECVQMYGSGDGSYVNRFVTEDNIMWSPSSREDRLLVGGGIGTSQDFTIRRNKLYYVKYQMGYKAYDGERYDLGYFNDNIVFRDNISLEGWYNAELKNNTIVGGSLLTYYMGTLVSENNVIYPPSWPTGSTSVVTANKYDPTKASLAIYNWANASSVNVDVSAFMPSGTSYDLMDPNNGFGSPLYSGTVSGSTISVPMTGYEFRAFAIVRATGPATPVVKVESTPVTGVVITGTPAGTTNYSSARTLDSSVTLTAPSTAAPGGTDMTFLRWEKNGVDQTESQTTLSFNISAATTCVAEYSVVQRTLAVQSTPVTGVAITGTYAGTTNYTQSVNDNTAVTLTAPNSAVVAGTSYVFVKWTINSVDQTAGQRIVSMTMDAAKTAVATYQQGTIQWVLTVNSTPVTGAVISGTPAGTTNYSSTRLDDSSVTLTAPATVTSGGATYRFLQWSGQAPGVTTIAFAINADTTVTAQYGGEYHVTTSGSNSNDGLTVGTAWDITSALTGASHSVVAGDIITIHAGTYQAGNRGGAGRYSITLGMGTASQPVTVRGAPGERVRIDGGLSADNPTKYLIVKDLEIFTNEYSGIGGSSVPSGGVCFNNSSTTDETRNGVKFVNLVIHDVVKPVEWYRAFTDGTLYGCIIYNSGITSSGDERRWIIEHNLAAYDAAKTKTWTAADNILVVENTAPTNCRSMYVQSAATGTNWQDNITLQGNIAYNTVLPDPPALPSPPNPNNYQAGTWLSGDTSHGMRNFTVLDNSFMNFNVYIGYEGSGSDVNCEVKRNTNLNAALCITSWTTVVLDSPDTNIQVLAADTRPSGSKVVVRPNSYDIYRGNLAVYNWQKASSVNADVSSFLSNGVEYALVSPKNFFPGATYAVDGVVSNGLISVPFPGSPAAEFAAYVVVAGPYVTSGTVQTVFPVVPTTCPPVVSTECPVVSTTCPTVSTSCPVTSTTCPTVSTSCPPVSTTCPDGATQCPTSNAYLVVQSTPITSVAITGTSAGTTNYSTQVTQCPNTSVSLTAPSTAASGSDDYTFVRWTKNGENQTDGQTVVAFNLSATTTCAAVYTITQRMLTVQSSPSTGVSITGTPSGTTNYSSSRDDNSAVSLTAPATITGKTFVRWTINGANQPDAQNVISFNINANTTCIANYTGAQRLLTVQSSPVSGLSITGTPSGTTTYTSTRDDSSSVDMTAPSTAASGDTDYSFLRWVKNGTNQTDYQTTLSFSITADTTCSANYSITQRMLTVQSSGSSSVVITGTPAGTTSYSSSRDDNTSVSLTAPGTASGNAFVRWIKNGENQTSGQTALSFTIGEATTCVAVYASGPPQQPDLLIKQDGQGTALYAINDTYQTTASGYQIETQQCVASETKTFKVKVENDDDTITGTYVVKASESYSGTWTITYLNGASSDITTAIKGANGYTSTSLAPGSSEILTVSVTPASNVSDNTLATITLNVYVSSTAKDQVVAKVYTAVPTPDLEIKKFTETMGSFAGNGTYETTPGAGQTDSLSVYAGLPAVYQVKVGNDAGTTTSQVPLCLKADQASGSGWTISYRTATGEDITSAITGSGYLTDALYNTSTSFQMIRIEVTPDSTVDTSTTKNIVISAYKSGSDTTVRDTVKASTTCVAWGGRNVYVATNGVSSNTGLSEGSPIDLATAFSSTSKVLAGDTVWIAAGTYTTANGWYINGSAGTYDAPIIYRAAAGARVTLTSTNNSYAVIRISKSYIWLWGLEVTDTGSGTYAIAGIDTLYNNPFPAQIGIKIINCYVHDVRSTGVNDYQADNYSVEDHEIYGSLIYNSGWRSGATGDRYGLKTFGQAHDQNNGNGMRYINNMIFKNAKNGIWGEVTYRTGPRLFMDDMIVYGNTFNGTTCSNGDRNIYLCGAPTSNIGMHDSIVYFPDRTSGLGVNVVIGTTSDAGTPRAFTGNYILGGGAGTTGNGCIYLGPATWIKFTGNTLFTQNGGREFYFSDSSQDWSLSNVNSNTYYKNSVPYVFGKTSGDYSTLASWQAATQWEGDSTLTASAPTSQVIKLVPNAYEPTKAYLTVYNRPGSSTASIDLDSLWNIENDQSYTITSVEDIWNTPAASGTWSGANVSLTLTGQGTFAPEFAAFLVTLGESAPEERTLIVQSSPITGAVITGTPNGTTNYTSTRNDGSAVGLTAPDGLVSGSADYEFLRWKKNGTDQTLRQTALNFNISANTTCEAVYELVPRQLTVLSDPITSVVISGTPAGTTNYASARDDNSSITLTAPSTAANGSTDYTFVRWAINGVNQTDGQTAISFSINADTECIATYTIVQRVLTTQSSPITGLAITGTPSGTTNYVSSRNDNSAVALTAPSTAVSGSTDYYLVRWVKNGQNQTDSQTTLSFTINEANTCVATYSITQRMLTVQSSGASSVVITGTPAGTTNYSSNRDDNSSVTLTAPSTSGGTNFARWVKNGVNQTDSQTALSFTIGEATTCVAVYVSGTPQTPDAMIKADGQNDSIYAIDGTYQTTAATFQIETQQCVVTETKTFKVKVQNDDTNATGTYIVKASESYSGTWTITYLNGASSDITTAIKGANGYTTTSLTPGSSEILTVSVTPASGVSDNTLATITIGAYVSTTLKDQVVAKVYAAAPTPDLQIKQFTETMSSFAGNGTYESTPGAGQTDSESVYAGLPAVYQVKVQNDAGSSTSLVPLCLKADQASGSGWTIVYRTATGENITSAITSGSGFTTDALYNTSTSFQVIRIEVTPDSTVSPSTVKNVVISAYKSGSDSTVRDSVKAATTCVSWSGRNVYVATNGVSTNDGLSVGNPIDLVTAFSSTSKVLAGDTVWLAAGTYTTANGWYINGSAGTASAPIIYRATSGARVTLTSTNNSYAVIRIQKAYIWLWGLEVTDTGTGTYSVAGIDTVYNNPEPATKGVKIINCYVHEARSTGVMDYVADNYTVDDHEMYGSLVYNNGYRTGYSGDRYGLKTFAQVHDSNWGNGMRYLNNVIFKNGKNGIWGEVTYRTGPRVFLDDMIVYGNSYDGTTSNNGDRNIFLRGAPTSDIGMHNSVCYFPDRTGGIGVNVVIGTTGDAGTPRAFTGNYLLGGGTGTSGHGNIYLGPASWIKFTGNTLFTQNGGREFYFYDSSQDWSLSNVNSNTYYKSSVPNVFGKTSGDYSTLATWQAATQWDGASTVTGAVPSTQILKLTPNAYESNKAYLTVYNRPGSSSVSVNLGTLWGMTTGQTYSIVNVENIWGTPAASGTWNGIPVGLMLTGQGTFSPEFSAYLVTKSN